MCKTLFVKKTFFVLILFTYTALNITACANKPNDASNANNLPEQIVIIYQGCAQGYHRHTYHATAQAQAEIAGQRIETNTKLSSSRQHAGCYKDTQAHEGHVEVSLTASLQTDTRLDLKSGVPIKAVARPILRPSLPPASFPMPLPRGGILR